MKKALTILCLGMVLVAVPFAQAALQKGAYAPDIEAKDWINTDEPVSLAELRGMVVVLFIWVTWHPGGDAAMGLMKEVDSQNVRGRGVYLIGLTDADRRKVEEQLKKEKAFFPIGCGSDAYEEYEIDKFPSCVVIDPQGKIAWLDWPNENGGQALVDAIFNVMKETPPTKTHPELAATARRRLSEARTALRNEDYKAAQKDVKEANEVILDGDPLQTKGQDVLDLVEAIGRDLLAQAENASADKDFQTAVDLYQQVRRNFLGLTVATSAKRKLDALKRKNKEVAQILESQVEANTAETDLARALQLFRSKQFGEAYTKMEKIVEDYADAPAASKAETVIDRTKKNDGVMGYVRDFKAQADCEPLLSQARSFLRTGRTTQAREIYRRIMRDYPDTIYEKQAMEELMKLPQ